MNLNYIEKLEKELKKKVGEDDLNRELKETTQSFDKEKFIKNAEELNKMMLNDK